MKRIETHKLESTSKTEVSMGPPAGDTTGTQAAAQDEVCIKETAENTKYILLLGLAAILFIMGIALIPSFETFVQGYYVILTHPSLIDMDGLYWGGCYGTAFINSGIMLLMVLAVFKATKTHISGLQIATAMIVTGFAFYGKNPLNVCFPIIGTFLYSIMKKRPLKDASVTAWLSTSLAPVFSVTAFGTETLVPGSLVAIAVGAILGILSGVLVNALSLYLPGLHKGRLLYNVGLAAGITGMIIYALQRGMGIGHGTYFYTAQHYISNQNLFFALLIGIIMLYFIIAGIAMGAGRKCFNMLWHSCFGSDFVKEFGIATTFVNMGVTGLIAIAYAVIVVKDSINGTTFAAFFTAAGLGAFGVTLRTYLPAMGGITAVALLKGGVSHAIEGGEFFTGALLKLASRRMVLSAIYSCGIAPIIAEFGWRAGFFIGFVHGMLVSTMPAIHGWMSLYNNAFSLGIIIVFLYPIYSRLKRNKCTLDQSA